MKKRKNIDFVSKCVEKMAPSGIRAFFDLVLGMKDVISLGVGEPDFVTPWNIRETAIFSLEQGYTSYTSNKGLYKLRLYLERFLKERFELVYCPENEILITVGVSEALDLAVRAIVNPGEEIIVPQPSYVSYGPIVELAQGKPISLPTTEKENFKINPEKLAKLCSAKTKGIILNYPSNPTGISYTRKELEAINKVCQRYNLLVITDEVYGELTYEGRHIPFPALAGAKERTIYLNGFSKAYAMTGWRLGYACGPKELIAAMTKIHQYTMLCAPIISQLAACEALQAGRRDVESMRREYKRRRDFMLDGLNALGLACVKPQGAFYLFASIGKFSLNSLEFANRLLKEEKVAVIPGVAFGKGYDKFIRISYASNYMQLKEAIERMGRFCRKLKLS
ncbi:MAG: aminotransferase class I/II-fold pyridoxal phosphate-dependent enzyme [Candidatus Omnitrophica bacterium]|nr:aminotransferase class I/II-fold pyridoxal phosphate-dependent enzyme [Candidatus Omnitrophota bacterium]MBU1925318.1 aminotransferase class I/II-fold pyridoxal phosphate-dependent enzyme [Candidatus Omnitrophota bacterium]